MTAAGRQFFANSLTALLLAALGLQCAWWFWRFAAPQGQLMVSAGAALPAADPAAARLLFGGNGTAKAATAGDIRLKGVYSADGRTLSNAVINLGGRDLVVSVGQEIQDKVTLAEVHADHILISRAGVRERIDLETFRTASAKGASSTAPTAGFRLNVVAAGNQSYRLSRQELNNVLQDPRQLQFTGRVGPAPGGGVRIDDSPANSLPDKLGLKTGDILTAINGQNVASPGDLVRFYQQFGTLSGLRVELKRGGAPMVLSYSIQP